MTAAIISGDPRYCEQQFSFQVSARLVWIDNIRICGTRAEVDDAAKIIDSNAEQMAVTWKESDSRTNCTIYEFLGGAWNHDEKSIALSEKLRANLPQLCPWNMQVEDVERLFGRLVYASGLLQVPLGAFYPAMKWYRRLENSVARGLFTRSRIVEVPPLARGSITAWLDAARCKTYFPQRERANMSEATLITDASLIGFGAILVSPLQELFVIGGKWSDNHVSDSINELEAATVLMALHRLREVLIRLQICQLNIVVDNTSVLQVLAKGSSKSENLNAIVVLLIAALKEIGCRVTIRYIPSNLNPSDAISRGITPDWGAFATELATWMNKRHGEGRTGLRSRVLL